MNFRELLGFGMAALVPISSVAFGFWLNGFWPTIKISAGILGFLAYCGLALWLINVKREPQ